MAGNDADYINPSASFPRAVVPKESVARLELLKGGVTLRHSHPVEVIVIGLRGLWRFYVDDRSVTVGEDQVLRLPAGAEHRAEALTDAVALIVSPSWETHCCGVFLQPGQGMAIPNDSLQDPDQYLWGV
jgi:hypothetical protein